MTWGKEWLKFAEEILQHDTGITPELLEVKLKEYSNKVPTHDPHTNPNAIIYYQCDCGKVLDCNTKSFAALNNYASKEGWKIRWGSMSYQPYCVECGKDVE